MSRPTPVPASSERPPDRELSHGTSGEPRTRATDLRPSRAEPARNPWFLAGLFATTLATLALEILDTRFLSVITWYHLSFFAVSMAMFGMSAGAVHVYLAPERFERALNAAGLSRWASWLAVAIAASHVLGLAVPFTIDASLTSLVGDLVVTVLLALPFYLSGIVVAVALTKVPGRIGLVYAVDLAGASLGCLLVIPLLGATNVSSATFAAAGFAALGAFCFARASEARDVRRILASAVALFTLAALNAVTHHGFRPIFVMGRLEPTANVRFESWNTFSQVVARKPLTDPPRYWGAAPSAPDTPLVHVPMIIDGNASTAMTKWDGNPDSLDWVKHDVTSMPYHLRRGGTAGVIGVGGGRDVLTALWANSKSVTGIEINDAFLRLHHGPLREFSRLADEPNVELVHDEARSYLTRSNRHFDVLQMSLIDTWASTGAGAYTLAENGLYTVEAWRVFLDSLAPNGIFSVSRWFSPEKVSETSRLMALGAAALLDRGIGDVDRHVVLVSCQRIATLLLSVAPFSSTDLDTIARTAERHHFGVEVVPGSKPPDERLAAIVASRSRADLERVLAAEPYDYSPPTDERPYFFNMLKASSLPALWSESSLGVMVHGNLFATATLTVLGALATVLVVAVIVVPLYRVGLPRLAPAELAASAAYFMLIGAGYMMVQISLMQRFAVYLGHPTYSIAVVLFSMIAMTGIGSLLSDRLPVERGAVWPAAIGLVIATTLVAATALLQPLMDATVRHDIATRACVVVAFTAPIAVLLGTCFPVGMRLVRRVSEDALPWMWGLNGSAGVLASILAVALSMWAGIHTTLEVAALCYASLVPCAIALSGHAARRLERGERTAR